MAAFPDNNGSPRLALVAVINPAMRALCRETLQDVGFTVSDGIESGSVVLSDVRERQPHVIILSEQLSDVPASEVIKWLRSNRMSATSPIIILGSLSTLLLSNDNRLTALPRPNTRAQLREALVPILATSEANTTTPPNHRSH